MRTHSYYWRNFWNILVAIWRRFNEQHYSYGAATLAYMTLFALFPFMIFLTSILSLLPNGNDILNSTLAAASQFIPPDGLDIVRQILQDTLSTRHVDLLSVGFMGALWGSHNAVLTLSDHLNSAYSIFTKRPFWKEHLIAFFLVFFSAFFLILTFGILLGSHFLEDIVQRFIHGDPFLEFLWWPGRLGIILFLFTSILLVTHRVLLRTRQVWRHLFPGAIVTAALWVGLSLAFAVYIQQFGGFSKTYGSLGAIACLMIWMYLVSMVTLLGGALNAVLNLKREGHDPLTIELPPVHDRPHVA